MYVNLPLPKRKQKEIRNCIKVLVTLCLGYGLANKSIYIFISSGHKGLSAQGNDTQISVYDIINICKSFITNTMHAKSCKYVKSKEGPLFRNNREHAGTRLLPRSPAEVGRRRYLEPITLRGSAALLVQMVNNLMMAPLVINHYQYYIRKKRSNCIWILNTSSTKRSILLFWPLRVRGQKTKMVKAQQHNNFKDLSAKLVVKK